MSNLPINISNTAASVAVKPGKNPANNQADTHEFGDVLARQRTDSVNSGGNNSQESAKANTSGEVQGKKQAAEKTTKENTIPTDVATEPGNIALPANILESLLAQPNHAAALNGPAQTTGVISQLTPPKTANGKPDLTGLIATSAAPASAPINATAEAITASGADPTGATNALGVALATAVVAAEDKLPVKIVKRGLDSAVALDLAKNNIVSGRPALDMESMLPLAQQSLNEQKGFATALQDNGLLDLKQQGGKQLVQHNPAGELGSTSSVLPAIASTLPASSAPAAAPTINTPFAHAAWADDFSQKITWIANQHIQSAELHLNPPHLGPLDVVLKLHGDQATATFTSPHAAVREAIEQAMPKLREMLADSGIMLGNAMVADQPAYKQQDGSSQQARNRAKEANSNTEISAVAEAKITTTSRQQGMVDTFA